MTDRLDYELADLLDQERGARAPVVVLPRPVHCRVGTHRRRVDRVPSEQRIPQGRARGISCRIAEETGLR
jgi:hypothetical protein